jgi:orotate phosphoribosyltransferase
MPREANRLQASKFIEFLVEQKVLQFGEFTLKSGRVSPYFFNVGSVNLGSAYAQLGEAYAGAILAADIQFDVLFGPAYKGIPIAVATSIALAHRGVLVGVAYNRKEAKDHGEGGVLVGAEVSGRVLLIDDVLTSGKAIREAVGLIAQQGASIAGAVIALDRQERDESGDTAVANLAVEIAAPVISIANLADVIQYLDSQVQGGEYSAKVFAKMQNYRSEFC